MVGLIPLRCQRAHDFMFSGSGAIDLLTPAFSIVTLVILQVNAQNGTTLLSVGTGADHLLHI